MEKHKQYILNRELASNIIKFESDFDVEDVNVVSPCCRIIIGGKIKSQVYALESQGEDVLKLMKRKYWKIDDCFDLLKN